MTILTEQVSLPTSFSGSVDSLLIAFRSLIQVLMVKFPEVIAQINRSVKTDGSQGMTQPLPLASFTIAGRPAASLWTGSVIFVSDGGAGSVFQGSNGTAWVSLG